MFLLCFICLTPCLKENPSAMPFLSFIHSIHHHHVNTARTVIIHSRCMCFCMRASGSREDRRVDMKGHGSHSARLSEKASFWSIIEVGPMHSRTIINIFVCVVEARSLIWVLSVRMKCLCLFLNIRFRSWSSISMRTIFGILYFSVIVIGKVIADIF